MPDNFCLAKKGVEGAQILKLVHLQSYESSHPSTVHYSYSIIKWNCLSSKHLKPFNMLTAFTSFYGLLNGNHGRVSHGHHSLSTQTMEANLPAQVNRLGFVLYNVLSIQLLKA